MKLRLIAFLAAAGCAIGILAADKNLLPDSADAAWTEVQKAMTPPPFPAEWAGKPPTPEQRETFQKSLGEKSVEAAMKAREFHTRFPDHANAARAKEQERRFVQQALNFGVTEMPEALQKTLSEDELIGQKLNEVQRRAMAKQSEGREALIKEFETGVRGLMKEYPKNAMLWDQLLAIAQNVGDTDRAKALLGEIVNSTVASEEAKAQASAVLRSYERIGQPLELSFAATDGTTVDIQKMKGKVVLLDFWASWCGPCIASMPEVIQLYKDYHEKGLEIVGINLDQERSAMDKAIQRFEIPWRQYFDGKGWRNKYAVDFNITAIPSMWLVDKRGILRTTEARANLEEQVKQLLAETDKL